MAVRGALILVFLASSACGSSETGGPDQGGGDGDSVANTNNDGDFDPSNGDPIIQPSGDSSTPPPEPEGSVPANPVAFTAGQAVQIRVGSVTYYVLAPKAYDKTHQTPTQVFIYLHGCGGASSDDVYAATNFDATWLGMAPDEPDEGNNPGCWDPNQAGSDAVVMAALADMKTHFNVDVKRVLIGGYSSGGDQSYYTALHHANTFAGVLAYNSTPSYVDTELAADIAAVEWKLNIVHLAHTGDLVYPLVCTGNLCDDSPGYGGVRKQIQMLDDAGFPVTYFERPGTHADGNTTDDRNELVYPYLQAGWHTP